ncbi:hypothetical protein DL768_006082 [Monosporascus sp. mg162]|nr:hypothetical protein DL768_006082 [Monosporascus sp. mg162]
MPSRISNDVEGTANRGSGVINVKFGNALGLCRGLEGLHTNYDVPLATSGYDCSSPSAQYSTEPDRSPVANLYVEIPVVSALE